MPLAFIRFIDEHGRPIDPGYGIDEGAHPDHGLPGGGLHPDQGLPGRPGRPPRPGQGLPPGGRPIDPGFGWGGGERPGHLPSHGGRPVDPGYGVDIEGGGGSAGQLPVWPIGPDQGLPPVPGHGLPPVDPPPGTIWPPLPPSVPEGKVIALVAISGVGYRYVVLTVPPPKPDQGLPPEGPAVQPPQPGTPTQPIQPTPQPKRL
jgi:hypothetical protein